MPCLCACKQHEQFSDGENSFVHKISNRKIKAEILNYMKSNDLLPKSFTGICQKCIDYVQNVLLPEKSRKRKCSLINDIVYDIQNNDQIDNEGLARIAEAIGIRISTPIDEDIITIGGEYRNPDILCKFSLEAWLNERNPVLVKFLRACAGGTDDNPKKNACVSSAVDSVYKARRLTYVAPLPFSQNLISYYISGSKIITQINNKQHACGSYTSLIKWLNSMAKQPVTNISNNDKITFFDNNQVIARNWRVTFAHKTKASVITMLIDIVPKLGMFLQEKAALSPKVWLYSSNHSATVEKINVIMSEGEKDFQRIRNVFIANRLQKVREEKREQSGRLNDDIQEKVQAQNDVERTKDPYDWVPSGHLDEVPQISVGEPALCNPCSYESVQKVIEHIQIQSDIGRSRQWTCAGCDGLPYVLGSRLIEKNESLQDILLVPGHGHMEMTAVKAVFRLLWDVCLIDVAKMLGYRTPRALVCCKGCTDHHKAWMILNIFFEGTMDELLSTYVEKCYVEKIEPSVQGLYNEISNSSDKNFRFMCDVIFNYILAIFIFRSGVRRNNHSYIMAGKIQFCKLFFGLNHTNYQEIIYLDLKTRVLAPPPIKEFLEKTEAFSISGNHSKGEGGDFILEAINGRSKRWLPPGIPKESHWLQVCRNLDTLDEIRRNTCNEIGLKEDTKGLYQRDITTEIFNWRLKIRNSSYLNNKGDISSRHKSFSGEPLDKELITFESKCTTNITTYLESIGKGGVPGKGLQLIPVFTTPLDRTKFHDIQKKTKQQISIIIEEAIKEIQKNGDAEEAFVLECKWQKMKVKTKKDILMFYKDVVTALENTNVEECDDENDSESDDDF